MREPYRVYDPFVTLRSPSDHGAQLAQRSKAEKRGEAGKACQAAAFWHVGHQNRFRSRTPAVATGVPHTRHG